MDHIEILNAAKIVIGNVFSDRSVSRKETRDSLIELRDEIDVMLDTLDDD